ncbi:hypothetical protein ACROYT_G024555 [Oculina patagonica]
MCQELMVDENACKGFVEHQEFLAMKAQKRASERKTLPNIDWNNEDHGSSLMAHKLRLYLKQHNLQLVVRLIYGDGSIPTGYEIQGEMGQFNQYQYQRYDQ